MNRKRRTLFAISSLPRTPLSSSSLSLYPCSNLRRTKSRPLATGATRGGVLFGRGSLFYLLRNRFYIGEVKYKNEILPGEQPAIMDRALFDAVQQKLTDQWTTRSTVRNASDHLLIGFLFDDAGHRMVPTHATKAGVRYRYYVSLPSSAWRIQNCISRVGLACSGDRHRKHHR
jgi:hypothetical protein